VGGQSSQLLTGPTAAGSTQARLPSARVPQVQSEPPGQQVVPQSVVPLGHWHIPFTHSCPPAQHWVPQVVVPLGHWHTPPTHTRPSGQQVTLVPVPQTCALGQHVPFTQVSAVWQHPVPQGVVPLVQSHSQVEGLRVRPDGQLVTQLPPQSVLPAGQAAQVPLTQLLLQHSALLPQEPPFGRHIGVVVEVVLVEVEVVLLVVELVVLLVEVVVEKHVRGFGSRHLSVPPHPPQQSQGCSVRWRAAFSGVTQRVSASLRLHVPSRWGMWQILTVPGGQVIAAIAREGISAAMAVPAKSLSALRRLIEPSASALARSSKERLVDSWLTCCPPSPKDGARGLAPPSCTT
jgi:hypothetical protein